MILVLILIVFGVAWGLLLQRYAKWGRTLIYEDVEQKRIVGGLGKKIKEYPDMFSLVDSDDKETLVEAKEIDQYSKDNYTTAYLPAQRALVSAVGKVVGWETIKDSSDVYLLLDQGIDGVSKYRLVMEETVRSLSKFWVESSFGVENVGVFKIKDKRIIDMHDRAMGSLDLEGLRKIIKLGDAVVVLPQTSYPKWSVADEMDNYLVGTLVLRRALGLSELKLELLL